MDPTGQDFPTKDVLREHFKSNGNILEIIFIAADKTYVIIFDNETAVQQLMIHDRLHHITHQMPHRTPSPTYSNSTTVVSTSANPRNPSPTDSNVPDKYQRRVCRMCCYVVC